MFHVFRSFFVFAALLALLAIGVHVLLTLAVGRITQQVFSENTACSVTLHQPRVRYFPLRARIADVHVYHSSEGPARGFRAEEISVQLEVSALLRKKVVINQLLISGAEIYSQGDDSAFIRVLEFVFRKPQKSTGWSWHSPVTAGWGAWVQDVQISSISRVGNPPIEIGTSEIRAFGNTVHFTARDPIPTPGAPVEMTLRGVDLSLSIEGSPRLPLGEFEAGGTMQAGILRVQHARVQDQAEFGSDTSRRSVSTGSGELHFKEREEYDLKIQGELFDAYAANLVFPISNQLAPAQPRIHYTLAVTGPLDRPVMSGSVNAAFEKGAALLLRDSCSIHAASARYEVSVDALRLLDVQVEDIIRDATAEILFNEQLTFAAAADLSINPSGEYISRCIPMDETGTTGRTSSTGEDIRPFSAAVHQALANSNTQLRLSGALRSQKAELLISSNMYKNSVSDHSQLEARVVFEPKLISIAMTEEGVASKVGRQLRGDSARPETRFEIRERPRIKLDASYDTVKGILSVAHFSMLSYPADRLAARFAPFLSQNVFEVVNATLMAESEVNASFTGAVGLSTALGARSDALEGRGVFEVCNVLLNPLQVSEIRIPVEIREQLVSLPEIRLTTEGGAIDGALRIDRDKGIVEATLAAKNLKPAAFTMGREILEGTESEISLEARLQGSIQAPELNAKILASSAFWGEENRSALTLNANKDRVVAEGFFLGTRGDIRMQYPFNAGDASLEMRVTEFPIPRVVRDEEPLTTQGYLSAAVSYAGPRNELLRGLGSLEVTELSVPELELALPSERPLRAEIRDGALWFNDVVALLRGKELQLDGKVHYATGWDATIRGQWDLAAASILVAPLEQISGKIESDLRLNGPLHAPRLKGFLRLQDGAVSFQLAKSVVGLSSAEAVLRFDGDTASIESFRAAVGDGSVVLEGGGSNLFDPLKREATLLITIDDGRVEPAPNFTIQFDSRLALRHEPFKPTVISGDVGIFDARYERRVQVTEVIRSITRSILGTDSQRVQGARQRDLPIELDVVVRAPNGLVVETDMATAEFQGQLVVRGTPSAVTVDGTVEVATGFFQFGPNQFEVLSGEIRFSPQSIIRLDPRLAIVSETVVQTAAREEHTVRLNISGTVSDPTVRFTSDSGLTENEIVALFGLGGGGLEILTVREERSFRELLDPRSSLSLRERIVGITGFRDVQIESGLSEDTGEFVPRVRARRPLLGESQLEVATELSGEQVSEAEVQYPLTSTLELTAGWRSRPVTDATTTKGSYSVGIRARTNFLGAGLVPPRLVSPLPYVEGDDILPEMLSLPEVSW